jgi:hypothetical protein
MFPPRVCLSCAGTWPRAAVRCPWCASVQVTTRWPAAAAVASGKHPRQDQSIEQDSSQLEPAD